MNYRFKNGLAVSAGLSLMVASAPAFAIGTTPTTMTTPVAATAVESAQPQKSAPFLGGIFGCNADGNKQTIGAAAGTVLGGLAGNVIAGRGSRTLGTLLGGVIGAAAGSAIGCKLQKNDQAKAERAVEEALAKNQSQTWQNEETGASGSVEVAGGAGGSALSDLTFARGVEPAAGYTKVGAQYTATAAANLRGAPNTKSASLGKLGTGQLVWVPASVKGSPWMLVSSNGVAQGYVSAPLLKRAVTSASASGCKMVKQTVSVPGAADESETLQACKGSDGAWVLTKV
jgi:surface antigen